MDGRPKSCNESGTRPIEPGPKFEPDLFMNLLHDQLNEPRRKARSQKQLQRLEFTIETILFMILMAMCLFAIYMRVFTRKDLSSTMDRSIFEQRSESTLGFSESASPTSQNLEIGK